MARPQACCAAGTSKTYVAMVPKALMEKTPAVALEQATYRVLVALCQARPDRALVVHVAGTAANAEMMPETSSTTRMALL